MEWTCCYNQSIGIRINYCYFKPLRFEVVCFAASLWSQMIDIFVLLLSWQRKRELLLAWNQPPLSVHPKTCLRVSYELDVHSALERDLAWGLCQARLTDLVGTETMIPYNMQIAFCTQRQQKQEEQMCQFSVSLVQQGSARIKGSRHYTMNGGTSWC